MREREENLPLSFLAWRRVKRRPAGPSERAFSLFAPLLSFSIAPTEYVGPAQSCCVPQPTYGVSRAAAVSISTSPTVHAGPLRSCAAPRPTSSDAVVPFGPCVQAARSCLNDFVPPNLAEPKSPHPTVPLRAPRDSAPAVTRSAPDSD